MSKLTVVLGIALIALGVIAFLVADNASASALSPVIFGAPILVVGASALANEEFRKRALQVATLFAALGLLWTIESVRFVVYMSSVGPQHIDDPARVLVRGFTAILCGIYLYFAIR